MSDGDDHRRTLTCFYVDRIHTAVVSRLGKAWWTEEFDMFRSIRTVDAYRPHTHRLHAIRRDSLLVATGESSKSANPLHNETLTPTSLRHLLLPNIQNAAVRTSIRFSLRTIRCQNDRDNHTRTDRLVQVQHDQARKWFDETQRSLRSRHHRVSRLNICVIDLLIFLSTEIYTAA